MAIAVAIVGQDSASKPIQDVTRSVQGLEKQAEHTGGVLGGLTSALGKVGLAGLGLKTAFDAMSGAVGLLTGPIQAASDLSESMNKVDVVFGDSARVVQDFAKTAAQSLGQSQAQALEAAGGFGNLFVSMGLGQGAAARLSTNIVTLGSDLASFNNIKPEEALEKLRAGLVGEAEPLRTLGVNLNEAAVQDEALRLGLGKSKDTLTEAAKVQARYSLILQQTKTAQGDFARTSTGMANATRIISASLADLQVEIGNRLLPVVAPLISQFALFLPKAMDALKPYLDRAGDAFKSVADTVGRFVDNLRKKGLVAALGDLGREVGPALMAGLAAVQDFAGSVVAWLRRQIGAIDWSAVWSAAVNVGQGLVARLGTITADVVAWLKGQWAAIDWGAVWASVTGIAAGLQTQLGQIGATVTEWVKAQWARVDWAAVWAAVQGHGKALVDNLGPITDDVQAWLVVQIKAIDWPAVWQAAAAGTALSRSFAQTLRDLDARPVGAAFADFVIRAVKAGIDLALAPGAAFEGVGPQTAAAFLYEMARFPNLVLSTLARLFKETIEGALVRAVDVLLDLSPFTSALKQKLTSAISSIFPLKVGPLTLGLGGVSVDLSGVAKAATGAAGAVGIGGGGAGDTGGAGQGSGGPGGQTNFQHGGLFRVGGSGGIDSQMVRFRATPGEVVAVGHARGGGGGGPVVVNVANTFHVANRSDAEYLADVLPDALARALEKARSQQGTPSVSGLMRFA